MIAQVGNKIAKGAIWMIAMRLADRSIGFLSTLVLARLLLPDDFGLVAMATAVYGFIEMGGMFGFDVVLIRNQQAGREYYDTAWTMSAAYGLFTSIVLLALALPSASYFDDPRLVSVMCAFAAIALIQGFENIGTVNFRKDFQFNLDFLLMFSKRICAFIVTLVLAYMFRSYWALLGGTAVSRISGVALSYFLHSYRPRFCLSRMREMMSFSRWILIGGFVEYILERGPDFFIGRLLSTDALGIYRVSREIATLPTGELIFPVMRAVFPGFASIAHDRKALVETLLMTQGSMILLSLPAGIGIVMLADPFVRLLLGNNWLEAIPLIHILGFYGTLTIFQTSNRAVFNVLGKPQWNTLLKACEALVFVGLFILLHHFGHDRLHVIAWAVLGAQVLMIPPWAFLLESLLKIGLAKRFSIMWRPMTATLLMASFLGWQFPSSGPNAQTNSLDAAVTLLLAIPSGAIVFASCIILLWIFSGRADGPEKRIVFQINKRFHEFFCRIRNTKGV
jgi:PST family polysaccharide transporter